MNYFKYEMISSYYESLIKEGTLKAGEKMPSLRKVCSEKKISMATAELAYAMLISKELIVSKPKSGFIVTNFRLTKARLPKASNPQTKALNSGPEDVAINIYDTINQNDFIQLSLGIPALNSLPVEALKKCLKQTITINNNDTIQYERTEGNDLLRYQIAKRFIPVSCNVTKEDVVTTSGCINSLSLCLQSITRAGDTIAVESPTYFGILQLAKQLSLKVIELPTHPKTGIILNKLEDVLKNEKIGAIIIVSNFSNPTGYCMPEEQKKKMAEIANIYETPLIEDDIYGDLYFGENRPTSCKAYDTAGMVLLCSSFSKTLAPGFRTGWILPGKYKDNVLRTKTILQISNTSITQHAVGLFLQSGKYEKHLKSLRKTLYSNYLRMAKIISEHFPSGTKFSQPEGGLFMWIELSENIDAYELYKKAIQKNIVIAPGRMFSFQNQYSNCIRLSFCLEWTNDVEKAIHHLGMLASNCSG